MNNLKQLGLGLINFESARKSFPAAMKGAPSSWLGGTTVPYNCGATEDVAGFRENWVVQILPHIEEQALFNSINREVSLADSSNAKARSQRVPTMLCPTDSFNQQPFSASGGAQFLGLGDNWARGNYGANSCLQVESWDDPYRKGMMGYNASVRVAQVSDGLSKTVMLSELRSGMVSMDPRGVWALGLAGSSSLWVHGGVYGDAPGPNCRIEAADDIINADLIRTAVGGATALAQMGMPAWQGNNSTQATARSLHPAEGVNVCLADGSVRWISDFIQVLPSSNSNLSVWDRLMTSADGQQVSADSY
jgi:hypothetical protein